MGRWPPAGEQAARTGYGDKAIQSLTCGSSKKLAGTLAVVVGDKAIQPLTRGSGRRPARSADVINVPT